MKQISNFMGEISDEFKIVVVEAIRVLTIKFPQKHRTLMSFLANIQNLLMIFTVMPRFVKVDFLQVCCHPGKNNPIPKIMDRYTTRKNWLFISTKKGGVAQG
jgi:hypothetical protein